MVQDRRGQTKFTPTLAKTFVKMFLGKNVTDFSISDEQLGDLVYQHVKNNPESAKLFNIVTYSISPEVQSQIEFIDKQINDIKTRQEKREAKHKEWVATKYDRRDKKGNLIPPSEKLKKEMEERESKLETGASADRREVKGLTKSKHDIKYDEEIKVRAAERQNDKLEKEREKLISGIGEAETKKEEEKEKRKRAKGKLIGNAVTEAVGGVASGFNLGRGLRGY